MSLLICSLLCYPENSTVPYSNTPYVFHVYNIMGDNSSYKDFQKTWRATVKENTSHYPKEDPRISAIIKDMHDKGWLMLCIDTVSISM